MEEYITRGEHNAFAEKMDAENDRQNHRIAELEENMKQIQQLTISVEKMAVNMESMVRSQNDMTRSLEKQGERLDSIEKEPATKWKQASWIALSVLITAAVTFFLSRIGL
ncbi:MAG: hypothetical protein IJT16_02165 [Lachnospiraceae bacterium]|nr:hypothetical protein [Lachnospiraceae bacterium]